MTPIRRALQPRSAHDILDTTLNGLLALHVRRGDYVRHCPNPIKWGVEYTGINQHPRSSPLRRVYVFSNEWASSLGGLKATLEKDGCGRTVDVVLDAKQYHVGMAMDMAITERAEVFVGNGFSSLSSNVVMLRLAKGMDPSRNRLL